MKSKKLKQGQKIELDREVVADLEATDADTDAIQGGARGSINTTASVGRGSIAGSGGGTGT